MFDCIYKPIVFFSGSKVMEIKKKTKTLLQWVQQEPNPKPFCWESSNSVLPGEAAQQLLRKGKPHWAADRTFTSALWF